jgi:hypothetical protein
LVSGILSHLEVPLRSRGLLLELNLLSRLLLSGRSLAALVTGRPYREAVRRITRQVVGGWLRQKAQGRRGLWRGEHGGVERAAAG